MSEASAIHNNLLHGVIVNYPSAIPTMQWVVDRLLWADHIGSIWPAGEPHGRTSAERSALRSIRELMNEHPNVFLPLRVDVDPETLIDEIGIYVEVDEDERRAWLEENDLYDARTDGHRSAKPDEGLYFYINKMPPQVVEGLLESGIAQRHPDAVGVVLRDNDHARVLMSLLANYARPEGEAADLPIVLEAESASDLGISAARSAAQNSQVALRLNVPSIRAANESVELKRLLDFRASDKGARLRGEYLATTSARLDELRDGVASDAERLVSLIDAMRNDVVGTRDQLGAGLTAAGFGLKLTGAAGMVLPLVTNPTDISSWAGLGLTLAGKGLALTHTRATESSRDAYMRTLFNKEFVK